MRLLMILIALMAQSVVGALAASNTMIVLDGSGSMWGKINDVPKIEIARRTLANTLEQVEPTSTLGLMAYGHNRKGDCQDIETLVPPALAAVTIKEIEDQASLVSPKGKTPLAEAVRQAASRLRYAEDKATVVLITDGLETCGGDPCQLAQDLENSGIDFTAHVVGFGLTKEEGDQLSCVAENTGGEYILASNETQLVEALSKTVIAPEPAYSAECRAYAHIATNAARQNAQNSCGYVGLRWSEDYQRHLDWCQGHKADAVQLAQENAYRDERLSYCSAHKQDCQNYAESAAQEAEQAKRQACGFDGSQWETQASRHYEVCMNQSGFAALKPISQGRRDRLDYCQANLFACQDYAEIAMDAALQNTAHECGYSGEIWEPDRDAHFGACMSQDSFNDAKMLSEFRGQRLTFCKTHKLDCEAYATSAVADAVQGRTMGCGFESPSWDERPAVHFEHCMYQGSMEDLAAANTARKQSLAKCQAQL